MNAVVYLFPNGTSILSSEEAALAQIPMGLQQAILSWIEAKNHGELDKPISLLSRSEFVSEASVLVRTGVEDEPAILFRGNHVGADELLVLEAVQAAPLPKMPHARSFNLSNGQTLISLTLPFLDEMSMYAVAFQRAR